MIRGAKADDIHVPLSAGHCSRVQTRTRCRPHRKIESPFVFPARAQWSYRQVRCGWPAGARHGVAPHVAYRRRRLRRGRICFRISCLATSQPEYRGATSPKWFYRADRGCDRHNELFKAHCRVTRNQPIIHAAKGLSPCGSSPRVHWLPSQAQASDVDWKLYGGAAIAGPSSLFDDANSVVSSVRARSGPLSISGSKVRSPCAPTKLSPLISTLDRSSGALGNSPCKFCLIHTELTRQVRYRHTDRA